MVKKSGIYTRVGDRGRTSLLGGRMVAKNHPRIDAYGTVDELMAHTSLLRDMVRDESIRDDLLRILDLEMSTASILAAESTDFQEGLPVIGDKDIRFLEERIDEMDAALPRLTSFVIPGGHISVSQAHVARTVCRRVERTVAGLQGEEKTDEMILKFYNRLSDYFFVLSRKISSILDIEQKPWNTGL